MKYFIIIFSVFLFSCSYPTEEDCHGVYSYDSSSFNSLEVEWLQVSAVRWNNFTHKNVILSITPGDGETCHISKGDLDRSQNHNEVGITHLGNSNIQIDLDYLRFKGFYNLEQVQSVMIHELGHSLGFLHVAGPVGSAIMNAVSGPDFNDLDLQECYNLGICER